MLVKLGTVLRVQHGFAFKSEHYVKNSFYRLVTLGNFSENNSFKHNDLKATYYGADFPNEFILEENDLIIPLTEQVVGLFGNTALVPYSKEFKFVLNQRVGKIICDEHKVDKIYLHYLLATESVKKQLEARASGTRQRNISPENIYDVTIDLPPIEIQQKIGKTLKNIEDQIERNNVMVKRLQVLAQSIYNRWFIQFDFPNNDGKPYKTSGGKMVYNNVIKRDIPEEWKFIKLKDLMFKVNRHFDYSKDEKTIDLSVMPSNSFCLTEINSSKSFSTNLFSMKKGDLLFGSIRPYLKKAGFAPCDGAVAGTVHCLNVYNEFDYNFCLLTLCSENMFDYASKASKGTKMPVISCDDLLDYPIIYNEKIVRKLQSLNLKDFISHLIAEKHKLTSIKNKLLPLLINGQLQ